MNWRRGLLFAAIHFVIAGALMSREESRFYRQEHGVPKGIAASLRTVAWQEGPELPIVDPCKNGVVDYWTTPAEVIVQQANLPAMIIVGWRVPCPLRWTLAGVLHAELHLKPLQEDIVLAGCLIALATIQWFLIGGIPLVKLRSWWGEPGAIITICTVMAAALALVSMVSAYGQIGSVAEYPMLIGPFAWLWWFGLLVWKALQFGWRTTAAWRVPHRN